MSIGQIKDLVLNKNNDKINWNIEEIGNRLKLTPIEQIHQTKQIPIAGTCYYTDNVWNYNLFNTENKPFEDYIINFNSIVPKYIEYVKLFALRQLVIRGNRVVTVRDKVEILKEFTTFLEKRNIIYMESITVALIKEYFDNMNITEKRVSKKKNIIKDFLKVISMNASVNYKDIYKYLSVINKQKEKQEIEKGKHKLIPYKNISNKASVFDNIVSLAIKDLLNDNLSIKRRTTACMIVILAETGMRIGEFRILQSDKLKKIERPSLPNLDKSIESSKTESYILEFYTYKTTISDGNWTYTFMTPNAVLAYETLKDIMSVRRKKSNSNYLILNQFNNLYNNSSSLWNLNKEFYFNHKEELNIGSMSSEIRNKFSIWTITKNDFKRSNGLFTPEGKKIYYITPHQYRVTCATILYCREHKKLEWIRRHMNHLSTEMTEHYIREEAKRQQKVGIAKALISRSNSDGTQLETDINKISDPDIKNELKNEKFKKAYNDINKFLKLVSSNPKKLNIKRNINEIIDLLYEYELPMTDVDVGYCMLDTLEVMCETQNRLTMLEDFNIQIPTLDSLYLSYKRFQDKIKIIEYNSKLYKINDNYIESYQRELNSMSLLINKRLLPELKILEEEIKKRDNEDIITKYSNLSLILNNFNDIKKEVLEWNQKIENLMSV
ncbi:tyrosine-type recombinase/integrase [Clostridium perfringens]|uniref:tyrosine-type recombinase/integrase n=2 Tax=Clostridium perfringens TaxID=1502 RepID=UPI000776666F|nr:tyrosine-type recombinase/integrase [Clostridium perfringens]AMN31983.1 hypothetical protein JFP55_03285 [Clostridium perfringens]